MSIQRSNIPWLLPPVGWSHISKAPAGPTLYLSGLGPLDSEGNIADKTDLHAQALVTLKKIRRALEEAGASPSNMLKQTIYVVELTEEKMATVSAAARQVFGEDFAPATTAVGVASLARIDMLIEVECIVLMD